MYNEFTSLFNTEKQGDLPKMKQSTLAKLALLLTAALWGSTFTIGKLAAEVPAGLSVVQGFAGWLLRYG